MSSREKYEQEAKKHTEETAATSRDDMEKVSGVMRSSERERHQKQEHLIKQTSK